MFRKSLMAIATAATLILGITSLSNTASAEVRFGFGIETGNGWHHRYGWQHREWRPRCGWRDVRVRYHHRWVWRQVRVCNRYRNW